MRSTSPHIRANHEQYPKSPADRQNPHHLRGRPRHRRRPRRQANIQLSAPGNPGAARHTFDAIAPHPTAEQLFAGAWSACYIAAVGIVAKEKQVVLPAGTGWKWKSISALVAAASSTSRRA